MACTRRLPERELTIEVQFTVEPSALAQVAPTNPTLYTLHVTSFTLHPTLYTLNPAPCTLHPSPYTLILHPAP
jgi:hypothetical protein